MRKKLSKLIKQKRKDFIVKLGIMVKENPKRFWSYVKSKTGTRSIPNVLKWENVEAKSSTEQAKLFNDYFYSVFPKCNTQPVIHRQSESENNVILDNITVVEDVVLKHLRELNTNKATGPDNISPLFLKECRNELCASLCLLFNRSFSEGNFPSEWKKANVIPVHKSNDKHDVKNYRPVSLLSVISKIAERCMYNSVYSAIGKNLSSIQHGFLSGIDPQQLSWYNMLIF